MNKKLNNPFLNSSHLSSSDNSFNDYLQNVSYSINSEDSTQIITSIRSSESINLKSVIFYLAIRKAFKNSALRYTKFSFYLIRSLYKETLPRPARLSYRISKISKEKKQVLSRIHKFIQVKKEEKLKQQILNFCKQFPRVRLVRIRRIETVTRVFAIFYKSVKRKMMKCFQVFKGPTRADFFLRKMEKFLYNWVFLPKKVQYVTVRVYGFLNKPKHNLPYVKFAQKPVVHKQVTPIKRVQHSTPEKALNFMSKKPEISKFHQRGIIRLCVLNRNYLVTKKKAFYKLLERVRWYKSIELKNKAQAFKTRIDSLLRNSFINIAFRIVSIRRDYEYFQFLTQVLGFVKYRCEHYLAADAFEAIYKCRNRIILPPAKLKYIYNFLRIINTKLFNKQFYGFILIKGFVKHQSELREIDSGRIQKLVNVLNNSEKHLKKYSIKMLQEHITCEKYLDDCFDFINLLKKIYNRITFYKYLETFDRIKHYSQSRKRKIFSSASKLLYMLKKRYTKMTALVFL